MRQRNVKNCDEILKNSKKYIKNLKDIKEIIKKDNYDKVCLEIGIGKGAFIIESASRHPKNLYIGIELNKGVVALATKKIARFEDDNKKNLDNLYVIDFNALNLTEIFDDRQVDIIYLNFSDPWPKKKHEKRRLTSNEFLKVYNKILKNDSFIQFKTDNRGLFEYSLVNMNNFGMHIDKISLDLHKDIEQGKLNEDEPNIMTEYEEKFSASGPIYKLIAKFKEE